MSKQLNTPRFNPRQAPLPPRLDRRIRLWQLPDIGDRKVYVIDGDLIRAEVDAEFALGGNGARYRYIPLDELWVEYAGSFQDVWRTAQEMAAEAKSASRQTVRSCLRRNPAMRTECCSCGALIVDAPPGPAGEISHGYCAACVRKLAADYGLTPDDLLYILEEAEEGEKKH